MRAASEAALKSELVELPLGEDSPLEALARFIDRSAEQGRHVLRAGLVGGDASKTILDVCTVEAASPPQVIAARRRGHSNLNVALVVPTGVGASIGGFIGDAGPVARAFEVISDRLILHPNIVNGADLYGATAGSTYVDGFTLDEFFAGRAQLSAPAPRRIGLIIDRMDDAQRVLTLNAANACRAVWGIDIVGYAECAEPTRGRVYESPIGHFLGELANPGVLYAAADRLISAGAEALAVVTATTGITEDIWSRHYHSSAINPVGAIEALISRAITWKTGVPCAHSPAYIDAMATADDEIDPRAAAEVVSRTGLPCILRGLSNCAVPVHHDGLAVTDLAAIVAPFTCSGGRPALASLAFDIEFVAVRSNECLVGVAADRLGLRRLTIVQNYAEAIACMVARRAGISWSQLAGTLEKLRPI